MHAGATFAIVSLPFQCNIWDLCRLRSRGLGIVSCRALLAVLLPACRRRCLFVTDFAYLLPCRLSEHSNRRRELHHLIPLLRTFLGTRVSFWALLIFFLAAVCVRFRVLLPDRVLAKEVDAQYLRGAED